MRLGVYMGFVLAACYMPVAETGAPCSVDADNCPSEQTCVARRGNDGVCESHIAAPNPDAAHAPCFGTGLVNNICFDVTPTGAVKLGGSIDTAMVGGANCTEVIAQTAGSSICIVAADSIAIDAGVIAAARGANPLVLIATSTIEIDGTLDVSSKSTGTVGPGAQMTCATTAVNGADADNMNGGGGAAGGSFGTLGSDGGKGNGGTNPGQTGTTQTPTFLVGGCPGGHGGAGGGGVQGGGPSGPGGGAVYLIAGTSITISSTGAIDASGAGGGAGADGTMSGGGAGGGGAGGFIGLDAPSIDLVGGSIFANGGGGGGGNGNDFDKPGQSGHDSSSTTDHAAGGTGGAGGGGNGGSGYASGTDATSGANGSSAFCGGGAGGGGAGIIRVFQSTLPATTSPPAS